MTMDFEVWLRMDPEIAPYAIPSSEEVYRSHSGLIDTMIANWTVVLEPDGSWFRNPPNAFATACPVLARAAGQRYLVAVSYNAWADLYAVLDDPACWDASAAQLITLVSTAWDAPWDGILYSCENQEPAYKVLHGQYIQVLSTAARAAGYPFIIANASILDDFYDTWLLDLDDIASAADEYIGYAYAIYNLPSGDSPIGAYWWAEDSIQCAMSHGIGPERLYLGFPVYSKYYPVVGEALSYDITHQTALQLIQLSGGTITWIESDDNGLIREKRGTVGAGSVWINDGDVVSTRLQLATQYNLAGVMLFTPGMGDRSVWQAIKHWKNPMRQANRLHLFASAE